MSTNDKQCRHQKKKKTMVVKSQHRIPRIEQHETHCTVPEGKQFLFHEWHALFLFKTNNESRAVFRRTDNTIVKRERVKAGPYFGGQTIQLLKEKE